MKKFIYLRINKFFRCQIEIFILDMTHRGTNIEIKMGSPLNISEVSDKDAQECVEALKGLVDLYKNPE